MKTLLLLTLLLTLACSTAPKESEAVTNKPVLQGQILEPCVKLRYDLAPADKWKLVDRMKHPNGSWAYMLVNATDRKAMVLFMIPDKVGTLADPNVKYVSGCKNGKYPRVNIYTLDVTEQVFKDKI